MRRTLVLAMSLACMLMVASECTATPYLDPTVSNAWLVWTHSHACGGCIPDQEAEGTYLGGPSFVEIGDLNLASLADGPGGGAFSDLSHGALGVDAVGFPDGSGEVLVATLVVNVPLTGAGFNTVHFNVTGSAAVDGCVNLSCENQLGSYLSIYSVGAGVQENTSRGECGGITGCNGISFPLDLSLSFDTAPGTNIYQFSFSLLATANGFAGVFAQHTGLVSLDLAQGVTMDTSSGFLTQPGDPNVGGTPAAVPEPATLTLLGTGLFVVARRRQRARRG